MAFVVGVFAKAVRSWRETARLVSKIVGGRHKAGRDAGAVSSTAYELLRTAKD
jgi:hypothetical protein